MKRNSIYVDHIFHITQEIILDLVIQFIGLKNTSSNKTK
ncbi:hypothetical protein yfred0001_19350 [Yersinia frederiksenii ATCC 33641]|nr:hypothetical protein yfred0001_19350 [Yersinia frederiksenii ATCC 33641]